MRSQSNREIIARMRNFSFVVLIHINSQAIFENTFFCTSLSLRQIIRQLKASILYLIGIPTKVILYWLYAAQNRAIVVKLEVILTFKSIFFDEWRYLLLGLVRFLLCFLNRLYFIYCKIEGQILLGRKNNKVRDLSFTHQYQSVIKFNFPIFFLNFNCSCICCKKLIDLLHLLTEYFDQKRWQMFLSDFRIQNGVILLVHNKNRKYLGMMMEGKGAQLSICQIL